jgi:acetylornithine deacetylase/succinyl-diaminopimelate desuccinylase-like protein
MSPSAPDSKPLHERPVELLQELVRFDTTNPPGAEKECILYIEGLLSEAGLECSLLARDENRPNLVARLKGRGEAPPLLLYGHVDVVTTANQEWTHPPFEGKIVDGFLWGRGTLDMKGGVAMMIAALLRAKAEGFAPAGDVIFAALCDEENGSDFGARFLVENHPERFEGVRYALGEFGAMSVTMGPRRFYPIQVTEKQKCELKATVRGPGGHGARAMRGGAMAKLGRMLTQLDQRRLPVHVTPSVRRMIEAMASALPFPQGFLPRQLLKPFWTDRVLGILGAKGAAFDPLLHNTVNATVVRGGEKENVIPSEIAVRMDGRILPGQTPEDLLRELRQVVGDEVELEVVRFDPGPKEPDMGLFDLLAGVLRDADPDGTPTPMVLSGVTDGRLFAHLGIESYGFTPMKLPATPRLFDTVHAADERMPVEAAEFGAQAMYEVLRRYGHST